MRRGYAETPLGQIHYREVGEGAPILLLHQTSSSSIMYHRAAPLLAKAGFRAIAMDTPGYGLSDPPPAPPEDMEHYTRAAVGLLDHLGIERTSVAAIRTGSSVAVELAASFPERVDKLVLTALLAFENDEERAAHMQRTPVTLWEPDGNGRFIDDHVRGWIEYFAREDDGEQYLLELTAALQAAPNGWWAHHAVVAFEADSRLSRITAPTLFLNPLEDPQYESTRRAQQKVPGSRYAELPAAGDGKRGRVAFVTQYPSEWAETVTAFLRDPGSVGCTAAEAAAAGAPA